jgi:hypothetical protein
MEPKLTIAEITYMRALAAFKTDEELAKMMDKPVELIKLQFSIMAGLPKRPEEKPEAIARLLATGDPSTITDTEPVIDKKKPGRKKKPVEVKPAKKLISAHAQAEERLKIRKDKNNKSIYKTKKIDLTGKVPVKLNSKTTVYVKPGYDIDELKRKYKIA